MKYSSLEEQLESHFSPEPNTGCWLWFDNRTKEGYGKTKIKGRTTIAHRAMFELRIGPIGDLKVLHRCDTPECVNPDHLFLGTSKENTADMHRKGRGKHPCGELHWNSKLTWKDIETIRKARTEGARQKDLAEQYGVSKSRISYIENSINWKSQ